MKNPGGSNSGRISLKVTPELHTQLKAIAVTLGIDVNGLLNMMIRRSISEYASQAKQLKKQAALVYEPAG